MLLRMTRYLVSKHQWCTSKQHKKTGIITESLKKLISSVHNIKKEVIIHVQDNVCINSNNCNSSKILQRQSGVRSVTTKWLAATHDYTAVYLQLWTALVVCGFLVLHIWTVIPRNYTKDGLNIYDLPVKPLQHGLSKSTTDL